MRRLRATWARRLAGGAAAALVLTTTAGNGVASAFPFFDQPPPVANARFLAPGKPVFWEPNGRSGARYFSQAPRETVRVVCRTPVNIRQDMTFLVHGMFTDGETVQNGYVAPDSVILDHPATEPAPCA